MWSDKYTMPYWLQSHISSKYFSWAWMLMLLFTRAWEVILFICWCVSWSTQIADKSLWPSPPPTGFLAFNLPLLPSHWEWASGCVCAYLPPHVNPQHADTQRIETGEKKGQKESTLTVIKILHLEERCVALMLKSCIHTYILKTSSC